ncbi:MAG: rhodanese-like domain-containing protein [Candidatus Thiodiazotropha sp.]
MVQARMLSDQFKHNLTSHLPLFFGRIKQTILLYGLAICLAALSMNVVAQQVKTELKPESRLSTSTNGLLGRGFRQKAASYDCTAIAERETEKAKFEHDKSQVESLDKNRIITKFNCLVSAIGIYEQWSKDEVLLVDVRRSSEYERYRIPGSLNLAPFVIKSKAFLKDKKIVLVNEGRSLTQLDKLCNQLKSQGLQSVGVMAGGLYSWFQSGYPITGDNLAISKLNQITPAELISALGERDWRFIDIDNSLPALADLLHASEVIEYQTNTTTFISSINKAVRGFEGDHMSGFIVVSEKGDNYKAIERLFRVTDAGNVFYLSGGIAGLKRYLSTHTRQTSRLARGFKEPHRCGG